MNILALTTSGTVAQVAIGSENSDFALENSSPRQHSEWLLPAVQEISEHSGIQLSSLDGLAIDLGPGSFTGVRVGFQLAQSLAFASRLPVFATSSLALLASQSADSGFVANHAFRNLLYVAEFREGHLIGDIQCEEVETFQERFRVRLQTDPKLKIIGSFGSNEAIRSPSAISLLQMARQASPADWTKDWKLLNPLYIRQSEAEEKAKSQKD